MIFRAAKEDPQLDNMAAKCLNRINSALVFAAQDGLCSITRLLLEWLPADNDRWPRLHVSISLLSVRVSLAPKFSTFCGVRRGIRHRVQHGYLERLLDHRGA